MDHVVKRRQLEAEPAGCPSQQSRLNSRIAFCFLFEGTFFLLFPLLSLHSTCTQIMDDEYESVLLIIRECFGTISQSQKDVYTRDG